MTEEWAMKGAPQHYKVWHACPPSSRSEAKRRVPETVRQVDDGRVVGLLRLIVQRRLVAAAESALGSHTVPYVGEGFTFPIMGQAASPAGCRLKAWGAIQDIDMHEQAT